MVNTEEFGDWPPAKEGDADAAKTLYAGKVEAHKQEEIDRAGKLLDEEIADRAADRDAGIADKKADLDAKLAIDKAFVDGVITVAQGSLDRARAAATFVQAAATAIVGLYAGALTVSFSATDRPLPPRGFLAAFFLAVAVVLATIYVAYFSKFADDTDPPEITENDGPHEAGMKVARAFVKWNRSGAMQRRYWLRASVIALAVGLMFLPAPFITFSANEVSGSAPPSAIAWPSPPPIKDAKQADLENTLYTAQVAETAARRNADIQASKVVTSGRDWLWIGIGVPLGLLVIFLLPLGIKALVGEGSDQPGGNNGPLPTPMLHE